jgi:GTPase SAR1 family protein
MRPRSGGYHAASSAAYLKLAKTEVWEENENSNSNLPRSQLNIQYLSEVEPRRRETKSYLDNFDFSDKLKEEEEAKAEEQNSDFINSPSVVTGELSSASNSIDTSGKEVPLIKLQKSVKCMIIGSAAVGKHTLIESSFSATTTPPETRGQTGAYLDLIIKKKDNGKLSVKYQFWVRKLVDDRYDSLIKVYYKMVSAFVFVYNISDKKSFDNLKEAIETTKEEIGTSKFVGLLIGMKSDKDSDREVTYDEAYELKKAYGLSYFIETNNFIETENANMIRKLDDLLNINDSSLVERVQLVTANSTEDT